MVKSKTKEVKASLLSFIISRLTFLFTIAYSMAFPLA
jgi:hypothetical protein